MRPQIMNRAAPILAALLAVITVGSVGAFAQGLPAYTAKAGMLNIGADPERPEAEIFHVAYTLEGASPTTRPVTFLWNGGPGAASIFLHLAAIGPKTIATAGDGSFPSVPARLETNPDSWIAFTDLVFIDPVGTGYSRTLPGPDGALRDPAPFYNTMGDLDSIAQFIRQWLTLNNRWGSPKAIAGESYGGMRVAALTRILAEKYSINLNRAVMISPELNVNLTFDSFARVSDDPGPNPGCHRLGPWPGWVRNRRRRIAGGGRLCAERVFDRGRRPWPHDARGADRLLRPAQRGDWHRHRSLGTQQRAHRPVALCGQPAGRPGTGA